MIAPLQIKTSIYMAITLFYDTADDFAGWISANFTAILSNDMPASYIVGEEEKALIEQALETAESTVDGYIRQRGYKVPVNPEYYPRSVAIIRNYVRDLATFYLYGRRGITKEQYFKYTNTIRELEKHASGGKEFPDDLPVTTSNTGKIVHGEVYPYIVSGRKKRFLEEI